MFGIGWCCYVVGSLCGYCGFLVKVLVCINLIVIVVFIVILGNCVCSLC